MSSVLGAHRSHTVRSGGSSIALRRAFAPCSLSRSASSMMMTRQRPWEGADWAARTRDRASSTLMMLASVARIVMSAFVFAIAVRHPGQRPQPGSSPVHSSAAAKARAATERPDPGGPVRSQA